MGVAGVTCGVHERAEFREVEQDEKVIDQIAVAQREELEQEIAILQAEAARVAEEARELAGEVPF